MSFLRFLSPRREPCELTPPRFGEDFFPESVAGSVRRVYFSPLAPLCGITDLPPWLDPPAAAIRVGLAASGLQTIEPSIGKRVAACGAMRAEIWHSCGRGVRGVCMHARGEWSATGRSRREWREVCEKRLPL